MLIGCPKEIKVGETRVALTPHWTKILTDSGHKVLVQTDAGKACGFSDEDYTSAGATIASSLEEVYQKAEFVAKVKELLPSEYGLLRKDQIIMTWFHLAEDVDHEMTQALLDAKSIAIGMELIVLPDGTRPTIKPMSQIAGSLAMLEAVKYAQYGYGGQGILLRKIPGLPVPRIVILGGGNAGFNAAQVAIGLGLNVTIMEADWSRIEYLRNNLPQAEVIYWDEHILTELLIECDVFINTIYTRPGQPTLVTREMVRKMKHSALIIDIVGSGIIETSHYTTLDDPIYFEEGVLHYNVDNMPSLCPRTATTNLLLITGPYIAAIANKGLKQAVIEDEALRKSIFTVDGRIVHEEVGIHQDMEYEEFDISML